MKKEAKKSNKERKEKIIKVIKKKRKRKEEKITAKIEFIIPKGTGTNRHKTIILNAFFSIALIIAL